MKRYLFNFPVAIESAGFKKAVGTDFYVHPTSNIVYECKPTTHSRIWYVDLLETEEMSGYLVVKKSENRVFRIHRLKGLAFLDISKIINMLGTEFTYSDILKTRLIINHKDGNKLNNDIDNLEWGTYSDNINHAFKYGLRTDNFFGVCYDVVEEKEIRFHSISALGREINIHPDYISRYLKTERSSLLSHRYMVKLDSEKDYPHKLTKDDLWRPSIGGISPVKVESIKTGEIWDFPTRIYAAKKIGLMWVGKKIFKDSSSQKFGNYIFTPINDYNKIMELKNIKAQIDKDPLIKNRQNRKPREVEIILPSGMILTLSSLRMAAISLGTTYSNLKARIYRNNGKYKDKLIRYKSSQARNS